MTCLFCQIVKKEQFAYIIGENEENLAILDVFPVSLGHTLIITKKHFANVAEINMESWNNILPLLKKVIAKIQETYNPTGFNIITNMGEMAFQSIFHLHIHIIPKYKKNEGFNWSVQSAPGDLDLITLGKKLKIK